MKKFLIYVSCLVFIIILTGCSMDNTPTKKVENFLNNYRNVTDTVEKQMDEIIMQDALMNDTQKDEYKKALKRQYQDMNYTIKNEKIDGDEATVTTEIEVYDFYKVTEDADKYLNENSSEFKDANDNLDKSKYIDYRIEKLKETKERVKYTIDFTLKKVDKVWVMDEIDDATRQKIHGLYAY